MTGAFKQIGFFTVALTLALVANLAYGQWANPTDRPPDGNISAPINVGLLQQEKTGNLKAAEFHSDRYCDANGDNCFDPTAISSGLNEVTYELIGGGGQGASEIGSPSAGTESSLSGSIVANSAGGAGGVKGLTESTPGEASFYGSGGSSSGSNAPSSSYGAGGGGRNTGGGGKAASVATGTVTLNPGDTVTITIGSGGVSSGFFGTWGTGGEGDGADGYARFESGGKVTEYTIPGTYTYTHGSPSGGGGDAVVVAGRCYAPSDNVQIDGKARNIIEEVACNPVTCEVRFISRVRNTNRDDIRTINQTSASGLAAISYWQHEDDNPPSYMQGTERLAGDAWGSSWNDHSERAYTWFLNDTRQTTSGAGIASRAGSGNVGYQEFPLVDGATASLTGWGSPYSTQISAEVLDCTPL
jgi:hypothetical protein